MQGLKYISWGDTTGYAIAAKSYVRALLNTNVNLTWTPMMPGNRLKLGYDTYEGQTWPCPLLARVCNRQIDYDTVLIHTVPEYFPYWMKKEQRRRVQVFGYTVWELDTLPGHWPDILNRLDGVIVPCRWNAEVFRNSGVKVPIHVVPHISQFELTPPPAPEATESLLRKLGGRSSISSEYIFYTIGFWTNRKGLDLVVDAYWKAFDKNDSVLLIIKTCKKDLTKWRRSWWSGFRLRNPLVRDTIHRLAKQVPSPAPWIVLEDELSDDEIHALHQLGNAYVSLPRAEGWGLGAFEAARMGKPIIMASYGGQTDFLAPDLAYLVEFQMVPVHEPIWSASYSSEHRWAEPSAAQAAEYMRHLFNDQQRAGARATKLSKRIRAEFSAEVLVAKLCRVLSGEDLAA